MTTLIEAAVTLADVAKVTKSPVAQVEADCRELSLFIGADWAGRSALSVTDAAALVSGSARRGADHAAAHARWRADTEAWEAAREAERRRAFTDHFDAARRRGTGDPAAASAAAQAASAAIVDYEKSTPAPVFGDAETSRVSMKGRVRKVVLR